MKNRTVKSLGIAALLVAMGNFAQANIILFRDTFESGSLNKWTGKDGLPSNGLIVPDPLNPANHVLTFTAVNSYGDTYSAMPLNVSGPRRYVLSFDFLGVPDPNNPARENGGFIGIAQAPMSDAEQFWIAGTFPGAITVPPPVATTLIADGTWHHYDIDFTSVVVSNNLPQTLLMVEDWFNFNSVPGDAFFDNIKVTGVFDINTVLDQVPCDGPAPGRKWKNHGEYVSTVSKLVEAYFNANIITIEEAVEVIFVAARSDCGKK